MTTDLIADTRDRILTARYHLGVGLQPDARTWIDAAERLADELERHRAFRAALVEEIAAADASNIMAIPSSVIYALFCDYGFAAGSEVSS